MTNVEREYAYKPKPLIMLLCILMFGACTSLFGSFAVSNNRGLTINGVIELSPSGATIFWWCFFAGSVCLTLLGLIGLFRSLTSKQRIAFAASFLIVPRSNWSTEEMTIPYRDITGLTVLKVGGQRSLNIYYADKKKGLSASWLPTAKAFDEVCKLLAVKMKL
jgi:hypothetical protein